MLVSPASLPREWSNACFFTADAAAGRCIAAAQMQATLSALHEFCVQRHATPSSELQQTRAAITALNYDRFVDR